MNLNCLDAIITGLSDSREEVMANMACVLTNMAQDESLRTEAQLKSVVTALIDPLRCRSVMLSDYITTHTCGSLQASLILTTIE